MEPLRILFVTTALGGGGAESHLLRLLNHLDRARVAPELAVARRGGSYEPSLRPEMPLHDVGAHVGSSTGQLALGALALRTLVERGGFDLVMPVLDGPTIVTAATLATLRKPPALVPSVQAPPRIVYANAGLRGRVFEPLLRRAYLRADHIVALSSGVRDDVRALVGRSCPPVEVIWNAVVDETVRRGAEHRPGDATNSGPHFVACGRLTAQKDFPTLLEAFARVRARHDARLDILGEGEDRDALQAQVARLGLGDAVHMPGFVRDPGRHMAHATAFVLSSRFEGFGNVLVEAMASGAPVVSTDCPHGPSEILEGGRYGLLVPVAAPDALARAMTRMIEEPELRARLSREGRVRAERFDARVIADEYAAAFERIVSGRANPPNPRLR